MGLNWIRLLRRAVGLVWVALLCALLGIVAVTFVAPKLDMTTYIIRGGSMEPSIPLGSLVLDSVVDPATLAVGDVITIKTPTGVVYTHRIVSIDTSGPQLRLQVQGDANAAPDPALVPAGAVIGQVSVWAPIAGYILSLLSLPSGIVSVMSMLGSLLLIYWLLEDVEHDDARAEDLGSEDKPPPEPTLTPAPA